MLIARTSRLEKMDIDWPDELLATSRPGHTFAWNNSFIVSPNCVFYFFAQGKRNKRQRVGQVKIICFN
jgi:hypothetical protein